MVPARCKTPVMTVLVSVDRAQIVQPHLNPHRLATFRGCRLLGLGKKFTSQAASIDGVDRKRMEPRPRAASPVEHRTIAFQNAIVASDQKQDAATADHVPEGAAGRATIEERQCFDCDERIGVIRTGRTDFR